MLRQARLWHDQHIINRNKGKLFSDKKHTSICGIFICLVSMELNLPNYMNTRQALLYKGYKTRQMNISGGFFTMKTIF